MSQAEFDQKCVVCGAENPEILNEWHKVKLAICPQCEPELEAQLETLTDLLNARGIGPAQVAAGIMRHSIINEAARLVVKCCRLRKVRRRMTQAEQDARIVSEPVLNLRD